MSESKLPPLLNWKPVAGKLLEAALNRVLVLDPDTQAELGKLDGRRVSLTLAAPALALQVNVAGQRLVVGPVQSEEPDLGVSASLAGVLGQLPFFRSEKTAPVGKLRINGDAELARQLQKLSQQFDPDWDKPFADLLGPVFGPALARGVRQAFSFTQHAGAELVQSAAEFVTEESRDVISRAELEAFYDDVDALRDRAERLASRISRLAEVVNADPADPGER